MSRSLIFLFDGSSNSIISPSHDSLRPTNMYYLNQVISNGTGSNPQISFYFSGVGTHGDATSAATGQGLDEIVVDAYTNLASNYCPGDQIYLFGFSRGATAARALSALVSRPGLLKDTRLVHEFAKVWKYYINQKSPSPNQAELRQLKDDFKLSLWSGKDAPQIEFVGLFDTVPGYNWDKKKIFTELRIKNLHLESRVKAAVHLLSIDDRRLPSFEPLLWERFQEGRQKLLQIWMPGVHGDVGGSGEGVFIGRVALLTMLDCMKALGTSLDIDQPFYDEFFDETMHDYDEFVISDELISFSNLLRTGVREPSKVAPMQYRHELVDYVASRRIWKYAKQQCYDVQGHWMALPLHTTTFSSELKSAIERMFGS